MFAERKKSKFVRVSNSKIDSKNGCRNHKNIDKAFMCYASIRFSLKISWWRRRESNPHPRAATNEIYTLIQFASVLSDGSEQADKTSRQTNLTKI
jgi:hypothetical protein